MESPPKFQKQKRNNYLQELIGPLIYQTTRNQKIYNRSEINSIVTNLYSNL